jgi:simple sugar transport system permease protein
MTHDALPRWADVALIPAINLLAALLLAGAVVVIAGESPWIALKALVWGAFGSWEQIGYTLFYTTSLVFTGLAVAVAFHCGLFNIGGEGQASLGGLGVALVCLGLGDLSWPLLLPLAVLAAAGFGGAFALLPGYLQARRGSHVVITTIMFNFLAAILLNYLLVEVLIPPGEQSPQTRRFDDAGFLPYAHDLLTALGVESGRSPLNVTLLLALAAAALVWVFLWRTRWGYAVRCTGASEPAARYGGISPERCVMLAMTVAGALAGLMAVNEVMGAQHRLVLGFTAGFGFTGIAVALMGRNHPLGVLLAALLFGALYQGGSELAFEVPTFTSDMVEVIQGLVILFSGALEHLFRRPIEGWFQRRRLAEPAPAPAGSGGTGA